MIDKSKNWSIVFDGYYPMHETKDPVKIAIGLNEIAESVPFSSKVNERGL